MQYTKQEKGITLSWGKKKQKTASAANPSISEKLLAQQPQRRCQQHADYPEQEQTELQSALRKERSRRHLLLSDLEEKRLVWLIQVLTVREKETDWTTTLERFPPSECPSVYSCFTLCVLSLSFTVSFLSPKLSHLSSCYLIWKSCPVVAPTLHTGNQWKIRMLSSSLRYYTAQ